MADVIAILFVANVIATVMFLLADVIAISLLADAIVIVHMLLGWWQMLLPLVGMMYHSMADVISIFVGWYYCHACVLLYFVADVIATMADGIAICENDVIGRCYLPGWQME